jgi:tRNA A-37 threonylcarbamoyl transferase component Bud32
MDRKTLDLLQKVMCEAVGDDGPVATLVYGSRVAGYARRDSLYDCMVIREYPGGTRYHHGRLGNVDVAILEVDNDLFLLDVKKGALGEFVAGRLLFPYLGLKGADYLEQREIELKERIIVEEAEELVRQFGEASRGLVINPEYFALSHILRRSKTYPPLRYSYLNTFCKTLRDRNMARVMPGYRVAIRKVVDRGILEDSGEGLSIRDGFIDDVLGRKTRDRAVDIVAVSKRALYPYLMHGRAGLVSPELISRDIASKLRRELLLTGRNLQVEDHRVHLSLRTMSGLVPLDERGTVREIIMKMRPGCRIVITPLGGALNEVYRVDADGERLVAKRFTDWHDFKWFTLNLVTLGTKIFSVSGRARLSNEFGMCHLLRRNGVGVPEVLHVSLPDKILVERYIEGRSVVDIVKRAVAQGSGREDSYEDITEIGRCIAKIHSLGIQIGDSKPENFLRSPEGKIYVIDLEQARKGGDFAWDIAEFLYYSGHYALSLDPAVRRLAESFAVGYCEKGDPALLKKAGRLNYLKVFSLWALPQVNYAISEVLRRSS